MRKVGGEVEERVNDRRMGCTMLQTIPLTGYSREETQIQTEGKEQPVSIEKKSPTKGKTEGQTKRQTERERKIEMEK